MRTIGGSIQEAIDWTQDHLRTTRPLAENTLFSMLATKSVTQTEAGFVLLEADDEVDEKFKKNMSQHRFHYNARRGRIHRMSSRNTHMHSDSAESMMAVDKGHKKATVHTTELSARSKQAIAEAALKMGISYDMLAAMCSDKAVQK